MEQFSFQALPVLTWLFESTIYISILICLIFIIKAFTKKKLPAWWSYCLWLLLLVRMLIPFGVETSVSVYNYVPAPPENSAYMPYLEEHRLYIPFIQPPPDASPHVIPTGKELQNKPVNNKQDIYAGAATEISDLNLSFSEALLILWILGVMVFGIATIYKNFKFWLNIKREQSITDNDFLDLFNECKSTLGIHKKVELIVTDMVKSPAIFGYIKPQLLLPPHFLEALNEEELKCVFLHELGHMKRHDIGVSWLVTFFQIVYWFNPLVWFAFHHLRADQEAACDAYVLSKIKQVRPTDYARTIVNLLERFVQNRQLPSLAGIIENRSQIEKRISMILDYKRITLKKTFVSVLMLLLVGGVFFACSNGRLSNRESNVVGITQPEKYDMKHYKNDDWNFSMDIPGHWVTSPPLPEYLANKGELISFGSNDNGLEAMRIFMYPCDPELSLNEEGDRLEKSLVNDGYENFSSTETAIGSRKALILDYDKEVEGVTLIAHTYIVPYKSAIYLLNFATTRPDPSFELYDRIAKTFEYHESPDVKGVKKYISPDGKLEMEIPANWNAMPIYQGYNEMVRFGTPQHGVIAVIFNLVYAPWDSLEDARTGGQEIEIKAGWQNFTNSEKVINERRTLILDGNNEASSLRTYYLEDGGYICVVGFFASTKNGIPADRLKVYERAIGSIVIRNKPEVEVMKEYTGPDNITPLTSGMKRYISPDGDFTVDLPGDWRTFPHKVEYNEIGQFGTPEEGLKAVFYARAYNPWQTLEERRDSGMSITSSGWKILGKSETVINGRKVLILDSNINATNVRNYFFKEGDYIYSVLFYAFNTDGIPADRVEGYERVMKSINIISEKPKEVDGMKEYIGPDLEKPLDSNMKRYISPDGNYTVDVPAGWRVSSKETEYGKMGQFGTPENGLIATFYPPTYVPGTSLEARRDGQQQTNAEYGWRDFSRSESVTGDRKTLILDFNNDDWSVRSYFFEVGEYKYMVVFQSYTKDGIPAEKLREYERIMKSINIIRTNPQVAGMKGNAVMEPGGITPVYILPVQFRFGENEPGNDLEEMTVSGSVQKVYLHKESVLSNADIQGASVQKTNDGFGISLTFTEAGGKKFAEITKENMGKILAIVVDGKLIMAPTIREQITGGKAFIQGKFTQEEAIRITRGIVGEK